MLTQIKTLDRILGWLIGALAGGLIGTAIAYGLWRFIAEFIGG